MPRVSFKLSSLQQVSDPTTWAQYTYDNRSRVTQTLYSNGVKSIYGYDPSGRTTALTHRNASNAVIIGYTASYDSAGRLGSVTENNGSVTSYGYDFAGRLLSENRTGTNPYVSTYTYTNRGQRATAFRSENGVASHNGTYTYDDAGRLTNVADTVTSSGLGGNYTWNNDSTLASYPGPGYTRKLSYDEEGRLTKISRDTAGTITSVFEYGYGFDGNRRWRKDLAGNTWDWYPCGVACCAGELVTLRSTNGGSTWTALSRRLASNMIGDDVSLTSIEIESRPRLIQRSSSGVLLRYGIDGKPELPAQTASLGDFEEPLLALVQDPSLMEPSGAIIRDGLEALVDKTTKCVDCVNRIKKDFGTIYPGGTGINNTLRHCVGSCAAVRQCGSTCAQLAMIWHDPIGRNDDSKADIHNNKVGIGFAGRKGRTCDSLCREALGRNELKIVN